MLSHRLHQLPGILSTTSSGETLLINPATGRFYSLSPSASLAWSIFAEPHTPAVVIEATLSQQLDPPPTAPAELAELLTNLQSEGLLVPAPPPANQTPYTAPILHRGTLSQAANGASGNPDGQTSGLGSALLS